MKIVAYLLAWLVIQHSACPLSAQETTQKKETERNSTVKKTMQTHQTKHFLNLKVATGEPAQKMGYLKFLPAKYVIADQEAKKSGTPATEKFPLMVFLHGAGERGEDLELVKKWGPPKLVQAQRDFPFVLISPQCPKGIYWNTDHVNQLIDQTIKDHRIDTSRIYITGLSMGGYGTWKLLAEHPEKFAAGIPICGGGDVKTAAALTKTPIWAFHGDQDKVVTVDNTTQLVDAVKKINGDNIKMTIYEGVNHNSWTPTYANPKIYQWLLEHTR